jgi:putative Holliday junction resolvase
VLAIDVGRRRIGLAGCDGLGICVSPLPALRRGRFPDDLAQLQRLVSERRVRALVVGLPLDAQQQPTEQALHCRRYGERLALALELPLAWVNEYGSSWAAAELHGLQGDRTGALDSAAAALLLQQWLQEGPEAALIGAPGEGRGGTPGGAAGEDANQAAEGDPERDPPRAAATSPVLDAAVAKGSALRHSEEV